jgi:hypothetical protein
MITRRRLLQWSTAIGAVASAAKAFAARLPRLGSIAAQVKAPAADLAGKIYYKGDSASYEIQRNGAIWNARKPNRFPSAIVLAENVNDVIAAVKLAKQRGWQVGTRSGGHSWTASHTRDNAVLINISKMKELSVDPKARIATVSPAWLGDAFNKVLAEQYQLMFPSAHCPRVGLGGFVMCGGHGLNSRLWGPGCANLQAVDVVTADGELIHADETKNSDFLWAARGSGPGFFGVVVRFYLNLHPLPTVKKMSTYLFTPDAVDDVLTWFGNNQNSFPRFMEGALVGNIVDGKPMLHMNGSCLGYSEKEVDAALDILEGCPVVKKAVTKRVKFVPMPVGNGDGNNPTGARFLMDGAWTSAKPAEILSAIREDFSNFPTPQSYMLWLQWGPVQKLKDMAYSVQADTYLSPCGINWDAKEDARCAAWIADVVRKLRPISVGAQMNDENMQFNKAPYLSKEASARLETMRKKYDPDHRFVSYLT